MISPLYMYMQLDASTVHVHVSSINYEDRGSIKIVIKCAIAYKIYALM